MSGGERTRVAVVTGSRAEFGLLDPVMRAIASRPELELCAIAAGSHLVAPACTWRDIESAGFEIAARVEMQREGHRSRADDAAALGRGVAGFADAFARTEPDWVVVLGDRVEAFAAAAAASVGGCALAHLHGGDRAEGIADEAMRHAVTKLAHLHLPATHASAERIVRMGEAPDRVRVVGSPAIDGLARIEPMTDERANEIGDPEIVVLLHPAGLDERDERAWARAVLGAVDGRRALALMPNLDAGREWIADELRRGADALSCGLLEHMPRGLFVGLLKRLAVRAGVLIGNSSAGLIECAALGVACVNVGPRQSGRERACNVIDALDARASAVRNAIEQARALDLARRPHPYGDGRSGERAAAALAEIDPRAPAFLRKRCVY